MAAALQEVFFCFKRVVTKMPDFSVSIFQISFKEEFMLRSMSLIQEKLQLL